MFFCAGKCLYPSLFLASPLIPEMDEPFEKKLEIIKKENKILQNRISFLENQAKCNAVFYIIATKCNFYYLINNLLPNLFFFNFPLCYK